MRREGLFLTRDVSFKDYSDFINQERHSKDILEEQELASGKRLKVDSGVGAVEESKTESETSPDFNKDYIIYDVYDQKQTFNKKEGGSKKIVLWLNQEQIDLNEIKKKLGSRTDKIKVAFIRNAQVSLLQLDFKTQLE
ncbi:hypothetical protein FGO68_gene4127 [Halteria grandinella]|uniref:Uncharacterized protein n=1 Tax=Halteria grandinella TaxID=5974 RepID=A0A8J8NLT9_HALGN|nr:hypothetical protein FGO68_gene4127 [Halteria grandinella]